MPLLTHVFDTLEMKCDLSPVFFLENFNGNVLELNAKINITWYLNQLARAQQKHHLLHTLSSAPFRTKQARECLCIRMNPRNCRFAPCCCCSQCRRFCCAFSLIISISRYLILWTMNNSQHFVCHLFTDSDTENVLMGIHHKNYYYGNIFRMFATQWL